VREILADLCKDDLNTKTFYKVLYGLQNVRDDCLYELLDTVIKQYEMEGFILWML
jgi:hypothetical protein